MAEEFKKEDALNELEKLEKRMELVKSDIQFLRKKIELDGKISLEELDVTVKDIDQIVGVLRNRRDVGH